MRKFCVCVAVCLLAASSFATVTVTGQLQDLAGSNINARSFVRFNLRNCAGNQPRVNGVAVLTPQGGATGFFRDFPPDANGVISGSIYGNDEIECGGQTSVTWYGVVIFRDGIAGPEVPYSITSDTFDLTTAAPLVTLPPAIAQTFTPGITSIAITPPAEFTIGNSPLTGTGGVLTLGLAATPTGTGGFAKQDSPTFTTKITTPQLVATGSSLMLGVEGAAPGAPANSGEVYLYPKSGTGWCQKRFGGVELCFPTGAAVPVTTKGDIYTFSSVPARLPVGTDGKAVVADSTQATGLNYATVLTNPMTTQFDYIIGGAAGAPARLAGNIAASTLCLVSTGNGAATTASGWAACSGTAATVWSALTDPIAALSLSMGVGNNTSFTFTGNTGASTLFNIKDATGNTGTGVIFAANSVGTSTALPFKFTAQGTTNGFFMDTAGRIKPVAVNTVGFGSALLPVKDVFLGTTASQSTQLVTSSVSDIVVTLPSITSTLVGKATTDILTNKTFDTAGAGNVFKINGTTITAISGNSATVGTTSGALTSGNCIKSDANGNLIDNGATCSGTNNGQVFYGFCRSVATSSTTLTIAPFGSTESSCIGASTSNDLVMEWAGTLKNLRIKANVGGVSGSSGVFTIYKNGSATGVTCTLGTGTTCTDTTHTSSVSAGDTIAIRFTTQAGETLSGIRAQFWYQ